MKKYDTTLFQIGETVKITGVTRKALLLYESMGLLTPAVKDAESGYRYYSADNMIQIRSIRSLQALGLTLKEVKDYYYNADNIDSHLHRLTELRAQLDRNIQLLRIRSAKQGDLTVHNTTLPQQVCFCRHYRCDSVTDAANALRDTYVAAARTEKISRSQRIFTLRTASDPRALDLTCCIPMDDSFEGSERTDFPETAALCIYYRGPYEGVGTAIQALQAYVRERHVEVTGPFRSVYLEGPPNRGGHSEDYITQVAVPIREWL